MLLNPSALSRSRSFYTLLTIRGQLADNAFGAVF